MRLKRLSALAKLRVLPLLRQPSVIIMKMFLIVVLQLLLTSSATLLGPGDTLGSHLASPTFIKTESHPLLLPAPCGTLSMKI